MPSDLKILVGTLHCGENEFAASVESLRGQTHANWDQFVLENLPNKEAHEQLYRRFMDSAEEFDLFLKLDADMILRRPDALATMAAWFAESPDLDHVKMTVRDIPSATDIWGVHICSNRARWEVGDDLFVDPKPQIPGERRSLRGEPLVSHCADLSPKQAYLLGVHRALKVVQSRKRGVEFDPINAHFQWRYLKAVWRNFLRTEDVRFGLAILGAEHVFSGEAVSDDYSTKQVLVDLPDSSRELRQLLTRTLRTSRFLKIAASRTPSALFLRALRKLRPSMR